MWGVLQHSNNMMLVVVMRRDDSSLSPSRATAVRAEAELWGWEASTTHLRDVQYALAMENYMNRPIDIMPTNFDVEVTGERLCF